MLVALLESSFLSSPLASTFKPQRRTVQVPVKGVYASCKHSPDEDNDSSMRNENQWAKLALVAMAAGVLTLGSVDPAAAAKTGGRVGGQAFRSSAPRSSGPRVNNSRTNVYINPPVAPPLVGGYGYGFGVPFYGGWGWSPFSFFAPGPSVAVGIGGGFDLFLVFIVLSAVSAVVRRFLGSRQDDDEY
ncbi:hypothetical protein CDL12_19334 [Handroanthus impetiginosus]|uniref:Transmembrane protein n=1 Tax=Handroanthus impetiginosus TaxID=429701 RepID=A0A2G9GS38_9LAMI|nr:hypothetical protein CDL12_19334 [Handroanthus impetiginosus]